MTETSPSVYTTSPTQEAPPTFKDGDRVWYETDNGLLGPFTVENYADGSPGLAYYRPEKVAEFGDDWFGENVHGILGDHIILVGWPPNATIDPSRFRLID